MENDPEREAAPLTENHWQRADAAFAAGTAAIMLAHVAYYFPRVVDDLFISLRYAENLAQGYGAVYNPGERVEGFSSPLWMLLQSAGLWLGLEGVTWTKLLGVLSLLWLGWALFRLTRERFGVGTWLAWLPSVACATNSYVVNWSVLGLETPLHLALLATAPLAIDLRAPPRPGARVLASAVFLGLGLSRPESGLYLFAVVAAGFAGVRSRAEAQTLARRGWALLWPGASILSAALVLRLVYFGQVLPNTASVKAGAHFFDLAHLAPLVGQGAGVAEAVVFVGGGLVLFYYGWRRRMLSPALFVVACACFTALVRLDWMPSLRHLLPITVFAPVGITCLASALRERGSRRGTVAQWGIVLVLAASMATLLTVDNRNSPEENRGRGWIRPKQLSKWRDTVLAYQRVEPPHVQRMPDYEMGQITQAWHVLEASAEPVESSWYVGRDIGAVGYYTGVRVFDTAGLFTPSVAHSSAWTVRHRVDDALIREAMSLRPVAGEIYEGWEVALGRHPELLSGYRIRLGSRRAPISFLATDRVKPDSRSILERYQRLVQKFPRLYHLHTLYGESMGAVVEKRLRTVEQSWAKGTY